MDIDFKKVLILDSGNRTVAPELREAFPNATIEPVGNWPDSDKPERPHYHQVMHCWLQSNPDASVELGAFLRVGGQKEALLDCIRNSEAGFINLSLGQDFTEEPDDMFSAAFWAERRRELMEWFPELLEAIGPDRFVFLASGNYDESLRGRPDMSDDLNEWGRLTHEQENWFDIAAVDEKGVPSLFSSDSVECPPECAYWGERVPLMHYDGSVAPVSGTSFACPFAGGHAQRLVMRRELSTLKGLREFYSLWGRKPIEIDGHPITDRHRKTGAGAFLPQDHIIGRES